MSKIGYSRVSSTSQKVDRQIDAIGKVDKMFTEHQSAKNINDRPVFKECIEYLRDGDELIVASIDRAARSTKDLLEIVEGLNNRGISIVFLKENMTFSADTKNPMNEMLLTIIGSIAQFERSLIKERQAAGITAAKKRGVQFGRRASITPEQIASIKLDAEKIGVKAACEVAGITRQSYYRLK